MSEERPPTYSELPPSERPPEPEDGSNVSVTLWSFVALVVLCGIAAGAAAGFTGGRIYEFLRWETPTAYTAEDLLGASLIDQNNEDVIITNFRANSPAGAAGLMDGDVIAAIDGQSFDDADEAKALIEGYEPSSEVTIAYERNFRFSDTTVILGVYREDIVYTLPPPTPRPVTQPPSGQGQSQGTNSALGVTYQVGVPNAVSDQGVEGSFILVVTPGGPAEIAGIEPGDTITAINNARLTNEDNLGGLIDFYSPGERISVTVYRSSTGEELNFNVRLGSSD